VVYLTGKISGLLVRKILKLYNSQDKKPEKIYLILILICSSFMFLIITYVLSESFFNYYNNKTVMSDLTQKLLFTARKNNHVRKCKEESNIIVPKKTAIPESYPYITTYNSTMGKQIHLYIFGPVSDNTTIFLGSFHGDEPQGKAVIIKLKEYLKFHPKIYSDKRIVLVPEVNPDGLTSKKRANCNDVDINRNFPAKNWSSEYDDPRNNPGSRPASEIETVNIVNILRSHNASKLKIVSIHSPMRCINYDGPAEKLACLIHDCNKYPVQADIGYSTPGSFGTYAGIEKKIPTVTLELPGVSGEECWQENREALLKVIEYDY